MEEVLIPIPRCDERNANRHAILAFESRDIHDWHVEPLVKCQRENMAKVGRQDKIETGHLPSTIR